MELRRRRGESKGASIGPSLFSDGDTRSTTRPTPSRSPCFNWAVALQRRRCVAVKVCNRSRGAASIGPSLFSDGDMRLSPILKRNGWARFNWAVALQRRRCFIWFDETGPNVSASIGPSLFSDGDASKGDLEGAKNHLLQLGRRSSATEIRAGSAVRVKPPRGDASIGPSLFSDGDISRRVTG